MNDENLKPLGRGHLTPEEEHEIRSAGGRASSKVRLEKKYAQKVKEQFQHLLSLPYKAGEIENIESLQDINKNTTVAEKLYMKLILDYLNTGNPRIMELIMRYSGSTDEVPQGDQGDEQESSFEAALKKAAEEVWNGKKE